MTKNSEKEPTFKFKSLCYTQKSFKVKNLKVCTHSNQIRDFNTILNSLQPAAKLLILTLWKKRKCRRVQKAKEYKSQRIQEYKSKDNTFAIAFFPGIDHRYSI